MTIRAAFVLGANGLESLGRLRRLTFAESDACRFADVIGASDIQFSVARPDSQINNTILGQFEQLASSLGQSDDLLFYFAGHGLVSHGDLFLVLNGTLAGRLVGTALPWVNVKQIIQQSAARSKVVILDCCHAGEAVSDPLGGAFRGEFDAEAINAAVRGSTASILVACGPDGFAREDAKLGGGVLTTLITRALGPKRSQAADEMGRVSLESLLNWMWKEIDRSEDLASMGRERPRLYTSGGPTFYLNQLHAPRPVVPVTVPYKLDELLSDVAQVQQDNAGFGTGRLVADNLILTACHTLQNQQGTLELDGWQVRLERHRGGATWKFRHGNSVVWHDQEQDVALIQLVDANGDGLLRPKLPLRVATVEGNNTHAVVAMGYPRGSRVGGARKLTIAHGQLTAAALDQSFRLYVDPSNVPDKPHEYWPGFAGSAVLLQNRIDSDPDKIWFYGIVNQVPQHLNGQLLVTRLAKAWQHATFRSLLVAGGASDRDAEDPSFMQ